MVWTLFHMIKIGMQWNLSFVFNVCEYLHCSVHVYNFRTAIINEDMKLQKEFEDNEKQLMKKLKRVNLFTNDILSSDYSLMNFF